jgi:hypothetical protein
VFIYCLFKIRKTWAGSQNYFSSFLISSAAAAAASAAVIPGLSLAEAFLLRHSLVCYFSAFSLAHTKPTPSLLLLDARHAQTPVKFWAFST